MIRSRRWLPTAITAAGLACSACAPAPPAGEADGSTAANRLTALQSVPDSGFERADAPREFRFPQDHGAHPGFRHEWWYFTGNLDGSDGERYGFELTLFRVALAARDLPKRSAWQTRQVYLAHFAVTDVEARRFVHGQRYSRGALGLAGAEGDPLRVWLEDWTIESLDAAGETWRLRAATEGYAIDLELAGSGPIVRNGERGLSRKSSTTDAASYYYSWPRLTARGTLTIGGDKSSVEGLAWLDREWGSGALDPGHVGWDWFAVQLDDGSSLMYYALRKSDGSLDAASAGTLTGADGVVTALPRDAVQIDILGYWDSPRGGRYPARWRLRLPQRALDVEIEPVLPDQELDTLPRYWEGAVDVRGTHPGRGYVELVGYAR